MLDDAARRQLRFSLFLQGFATLFFLGATIVRGTSAGVDVLTAVFALGTLICGGAFVFTLRYLRSH